MIEPVTGRKWEDLEKIRSYLAHDRTHVAETHLHTFMRRAKGEDLEFARAIGLLLYGYKNQALVLLNYWLEL